MNPFEKFNKREIETSKKDINLSRFNSDFKSFFESRGFVNLSEAEAHSNKVYFGEKDGKEVFLKKYIDGEGRESKALLRCETEIACYKNLPKDHLLNMVDSNKEEGYLILDKANLEKIILEKESVKQILDIYLHELALADASFLQETNWKDYEELFVKIKNLESKNIVTNTDSIIKKFEDKRELIESSQKVFSHNDFNTSNIKSENGRLIILDFERAKRDNAMVDLATLYIDLYNNQNLMSYYEENIKQSPLYNKDLFDLMLLRRCILVINSLSNNQQSSYFKKNLEVFKRSL